MSKRIISIGISLPDFESHSFTSDQSLLDADIIVFQPNLERFFLERYAGLPSCPKSLSHQCTESIKHWRTEIEMALENGKTVFVFLNKYQDFYGYKRVITSSTATSKTTTTLELSKLNNYWCLPLGSIDMARKSGDTVKFMNNPIFVQLWEEAGTYLVYESYFNQSPGTPLFITKSGNKTIGCLIKTPENDHLILLPQIVLPQSFMEQGELEGLWTEEGSRFGQRFVAVLVKIDAALRKEEEAIPAPAWVDGPEYAMVEEARLLESIAAITAKVDGLSNEKADQSRELAELQSLKFLLYGQGFPLQDAVIEALELLGYKAEGYDDGELEIDQVIVSPEGKRFVGETEGKDNSAINIDKFRQLFEIIDADAARGDIEEEATGILFGNGYRTQEPGERDIQFTDKCLTGAKRRSVVLVQTSDLFRVAQYIRDSEDEEFSAKCREAIKNSEGKIVEFPTPPM
jgi:hypothetical protein